MPSATDPPLDLVITDLHAAEHSLHAQTPRARDYLSRVLEFHLLPRWGDQPGHRALLISREVLTDWLFQDTQDNGLGLYTYAEHPETGAVELALVTHQV